MNLKIDKAHFTFGFGTRHPLRNSCHQFLAGLQRSTRAAKRPPPPGGTRILPAPFIAYLVSDGLHPHLNCWWSTYLH
jgi:hypothetical protein